jgi:ATP:ADP antiporter, AAA family
MCGDRRGEARRDVVSEGGAERQGGGAAEARAGWWAAACAGGMIAHQVAAKATRDALFLTHYEVEALPLMLVVASALAVVAVVAGAKGMGRAGPWRVVVGAFAASGLLSLGEWALLGWRGEVGSVVVFVHVTALSAVLISGFWSLVGERFDPHTARRWMGRIGAGAAFGGLLGGVIAERVGAMLSAQSMLPVLAALHGACALVAWRGMRPRAPQGDGGSDGFSVVRSIGELWMNAYLRRVVGLVVLGTMGAALMDYVFKARAAATLRNGEDLLRFFATFYTVVGVATFGVQAVFSGKLWERVGMTRAVATLPAVVVMGSVGAAAWPGLMGAAAARGMELVARSSAFRAGYETLFLPLSAAQRRATKLWVDVGFDRVGDVLGAGVIGGVLASKLNVEIMWGLAAAAGVGALLMTRALRQGYVEALERNLVDRAASLEDALEEDAGDAEEEPSAQSSGEGASLVGSSGIRSQSGRREDSGAGIRADARGAESRLSADPLIEQIALLRSGDIMRIQAFLAAPPPLDRALVAHLVPLLARGRLSGRVIEVLRAFGEVAVGQLVDVLWDRDAAFVIRRRLPRVLAGCPCQRAVDGLVRGLQDSRFEVRFHCARALALLTASAPDLVLDPKRVWRGLEAELEFEEERWRKRALIDPPMRGGEHPLDDGLVGVSAGVMYVFTMLSMVLPGPPLRAALIGLRSADRNLKGTAREYLERVIPQRLCAGLWAIITRLLSGGHGHSAAAYAVPTPHDRATAQSAEALAQSAEALAQSAEALALQAAAQRVAKEVTHG